MRHIFLMIAAVIPCLARGQSLIFKNYTVADGLVANPVRCIYQDSKGFLWIGTYDGLSRYDGHKFTNYTNINGLSDNFINSIIEVKGKLLVAQNDGAVEIIKDNIIQKRLKAPSAVNNIAPVNSRLIFTTDGDGFYELMNDSIVFPPQQRTNDPMGQVFQLNDSLLLVDGLSRNLRIVGNDLRTRFFLDNKDVLNYSFSMDSKGRLWVCTSEGLRLLNVSFFGKPALTYQPLPPDFDIPPLKNVHVTSLVEELDGSYWIGTWKGLVRIFPGGGYHVYNEREGLPSDRINTLYRDREHNLWIGTYLGLAKWVSKNNVVFYNTPLKTFRNDVTSAQNLDGKKLILGTYHGLQKFDTDSKEFTDLSGTESQSPCMIANTSPLMVHYGNKIGRIDTSANRVVPVQTLDTAIDNLNCAIGTIKETFFLGTLSALYAVRNGVVKKILPLRVTALTIDKAGILWVGTWSEGLYRVLVRDGPGINCDVEDITYLVNRVHIRGLYTDRSGAVWVATRHGGAYCLTPKPGGKFDILNFNRQSGLMSDWVAGFGETGSGDIWIASFLGLDKLIKEPSGYRVFNFSKAINFFAEIRQIVSLGNDRWLCAANTGVVTFRDEKLHLTPPLQASILTASLGLQHDRLSIFFPVEKVRLRHYQNSARFEFSSPGFMNEKGMLYTYRLKGSNDTAWSKPEAVHEASYESLPPGEYTFEVNTLGWNGQRGTPATFSFFISTPFWRRAWFIALCALLVAALIYSLYRYRVRQIMHLQKVRNTIATDLHDDIGSALTNISILAELSRNKNERTAFTENLGGRIAEESTLAQQALDDIIWSVNSNNDTLNQTMARMRRYVAEVFEPVGIDCRLDFENIPDDLKLNMEQRKDIYLVFKECLNNIIKHAAARNALLKIGVTKNMFHLVIQDDGKGFDPQVESGRNGLKNIRSRVERWNGKLDIRSTAGAGTTVDCHFPLVSPK